MSATPGKLLAQAKQGDPKAIAALMNRSTQSKGISVKASLKERCLQVLFEGNVVPHQGKTLEFVRDGMAKLQVETVDRVKVYGRQVGQETPVWQDEIVLASSNPFNEETDDLDLGMEDYDDPSAISDTDFPEPPVGADSFLNEDVEAGFDETMDDDYDENFDAEGYDGEAEPLSANENEDASDADSNPGQKKPGVTLAAVLAVLLLLILGGGYYVYSARPELLEALPFFGVDDDGNIEFTPSMDDAGTEDATPAEDTTSPEAGDPAQNDAPVDPFSLGVNAAIEASEKTQSAQSREEWQEIAGLWETAIAQMEAVPEDHPQYDVAQNRAESYQTNLQYARQQAQ